MIRSHLLLGAFAGLSATAQAAIVSINFVGFADTNGTLFSDEAAGAIAAENWNNVLPDNAADINYSSGALVDSTGSATSVTVSWLSIGPYLINTGTGTPDNVMYNGYLDNFGDDRTVTIAGLIPTETYQVYVYSDGDNGTNTRTGTFTMGGVTTGITDAPGNYSGTYFEVAPGTAGEGNYTVFTLTGSSSYDLVFHGNTTDDLPRAALNGMQIVSVPEPASMVLGIVGLFPLFRRRRN